MRLPVNVPYHPETETPVSLVSRLARAMGFASIDELVRSGGTTVHAVARGEDDAMRTLSSWSGVSTDRLRRFAVPTRGEAGEWRLGDAVFRKEMRVAGRFRFCPRCLVEDVENGSGRPQSRPFVRAAWLTRAVMACTRHGELLVEGDEDAPENDVAMFTAKGWHLECQSGGSADDAELAVDAYIEGRITGNRTESFIDRQEVYVLLMLFHFIGWLLHNHLPSFIVGGKAASSHSVRAAGYLVALGGREAIEMVVRQAVDLHRPAAHNTTEFFGPMVRRLRHNAAVPAYAEVVGLFQDLVERYVPVGPGDHFIFPVQRRQLHSVRSATFEYRLDRKRIRTLVEERGVIAPSRLSDRRVYFSVEAADEILADAVGNMTTVEVAAVLGTHDDRVRDLIDRGHIVASERGANSDRPFYRIGKADLDDFRERLFRHALIARGAHGLVSLAAAAQQGSVTQSDVIGMILDGKLANVARTDASMTLGSLLVDLRQVIASVVRPLRDESGTPLYLNFTEVERALSTTTVTVTALVKNGVLPVEVRTNPKTKRQQPFVHRQSIDAFLDSHRSLHRIARGWRRNIGVMKDELDRNGMRPIFETSGKIARYYRKEDLARAALLPPTC
ncbi:TniQ family protein [Pseudaminobacter soli (ex Li et al. 2025)]|uniref:TniQ domain-containing protein n=1 Tax=Pseudaminobacter soli (ex Li et al. 2025) TaxID=1295366 RepID=A0A2P7SGM3_9HYPH|nr:TniQ family protein [Mesorhizobium soli]PSJ61633.1 hypothetical protein C7I85_11415 [Mesorhizobium soli]